MDSVLLLRLGMTIGLITAGVVGYKLWQKVQLGRTRRNRLGLESFEAGTPAILYFTAPGCMPCKTVQRPALSELQVALGSKLQVIEVDAMQHRELADFWGVLSVPTTFVIDSTGEPRLVNNGVARAVKLYRQLESVEGRALLETPLENSAARPGVNPAGSD